MAHYWRELAETATGTLMTVAIDTSGLLGTVDSAHRKLGTYEHTLRTLQAETTADGQFDGPFPSAALHGALRGLGRLNTLYSGAGYVYNLYARRFAHVDVEEPLYQSWRGHIRDTVFHARDAKQKLRSAASYARAAEDAIHVVRSFPRGSPDWTAWKSEALRLAIDAGVSAALALHALRRMSDAVALEFHDARRILDR